MACLLSCLLSWKDKADKAEYIGGLIIMSGQKNGERKHLFGTTEKSDFILNMSQEQTFKLCGLYSIIAIAVLAAMNIPFTILKHTFDSVDEDNITHYADDLIYPYKSQRNHKE